MRNAGIRLTQDGSAKSSSALRLSFGDVKLHSLEGSNIVVGERSVDFFFDPNNFPIVYNGDKINMEMRWTDDGDTMVVHRVSADRQPLYSLDGQAETSASISVDKMNDAQRMTAFCYLVGKVTQDAG